MIPAPLQNTPCLFLSKEDHSKSGSDYLAVVEAKDLLPLAELFLKESFLLEDVSGLEAAEGAVSVYHFDNFEKPCRCTILVIAPAGSPKFPSIAPLYQGAEWHERETRDFFGFAYEGNPNFVPLLMPDDMAEVHPLQKKPAARAPLATLFASPERNREILSVAEGFVLLGVKEEEKPAGEAESASATPEKSTPDQGENNG